MAAKENWPIVTLGRDEHRTFFSYGPGHETETYIPESALLSAETIRAGTAAGLAMPEDGSEDFDAVTRQVLQAALDATKKS